MKCLLVLVIRFCVVGVVVGDPILSSTAVLVLVIRCFVVGAQICVPQGSALRCGLGAANSSVADLHTEYFESHT